MPTFMGVEPWRSLADKLVALISTVYIDYPVSRMIYEDFEDTAYDLNFTGTVVTTNGSYSYGSKHLNVGGNSQITASFAVERNAIFRVAARGSLSTQGTTVCTVALDNTSNIVVQVTNHSASNWQVGTKTVQPGEHQIIITHVTYYANNSSVDDIMIIQQGLGISSRSIGLVTSLDTNPLECMLIPYLGFNSPDLPVQYLVKAEGDYVILAVQGIFQVDSSGRTHIAYLGRLGTPPNTPLAYGAASTMGSANLTATLSDNRRASVQSTYNVYPSQVPVSPDIQNRFALVPIYVYRSDENWRGWFNDLYVAQIPPQTMLNGETVTAQDGSKYTFFNIPPSGDGYYNNFLASGDTDKWLVIKH